MLNHELVFGVLRYWTDDVTKCIRISTNCTSPTRCYVQGAVMINAMELDGFKIEEADAPECLHPYVITPNVMRYGADAGKVFVSRYKKGWLFGKCRKDGSFQLLHEDGKDFKAAGTFIRQAGGVRAFIEKSKKFPDLEAAYKWVSEKKKH